jgi:hypothetical protein
MSWNDIMPVAIIMAISPVMWKVDAVLQAGRCVTEMFVHEIN